MFSTIARSRWSSPKKWSRMYAPVSVAYVWNCPSGVEFILLTRMPSRSCASSGSQERSQISLMTFQPAPRNCDSSSWMILPLPRTGPSSRCRLQFTTKVRLSRPSRAAIDSWPSDSGSSISPSPRYAQTCDFEVSAIPRASMYRFIRAW